MKSISRRHAIKQISGTLASAMFISSCARDAETEIGMTGLTGLLDVDTKPYRPNPILFGDDKPVVAITAIPDKMSKKSGIDHAVREAIDLLGGMTEIAHNKERILIKPNLVDTDPQDTTSPEVIESLVKLMQEAGKDVSIGEGTAGAKQNTRLSVLGFTCRTKEVDVLNGIQNEAFTQLGYADLSVRLKIPLVNLHTGQMVGYTIPENYVFNELYMHSALHEADLICTAPMMKTHGLAGVTLGMKNFIGAFPGQVYGTVRSRVHQVASAVEPSGTASAIVDMVRGSNVGLTVIDGTTAMEGQGPTIGGGGSLVEMGLIVAGRNALATDMVGANVMGFQPEEISTFEWAWKAGMQPARIEDIEVRGKSLETVRRHFKRPNVVPYREISSWYGPVC